MSFLPKPGDTAALKFWGLDSRGARVTVLGILSVALLAVGIWLAVTGGLSVAAANAILDGGLRTTATVVSVQTTVPNPVGAPEDTVKTTTVRFTTDDGTSVDTDLPAAGIQRELAAGDDVDIVYDSDDPASVLLDAPGVTSSLWAGVAIGFVLAILGLFLGLVALRIFRRAQPTPA